MKKIFILDDDAGLQDLFRIIFEKAGYQIFIESGGENILKGNYELPDIFLIDLQLAGPDGIFICKYLKSSSKANNIPVIMMSASPDINSLSITACADGYIEKPFSINDLLTIINMHVQKSTCQE